MVYMYIVDYYFVGIMVRIRVYVKWNEVDLEE